MSRQFHQKKWADYSIDEFTRVQEQCYTEFEDVLNELYDRLILESIQKNGEYRKRIQSINLDYEDSLILYRIAEYGLKQLNGILYNISIGLYHQVIRELRFLLESWVVAIYVDRYYPLDDLSEKICRNEVNLRGKKLFRKAFNFTNESNLTYQKFINTYKKLSRTVHTSKDELERFNTTERAERMIETMLNYDREQVEYCIELLEEVHHLLMSIM